NSLEYVIVLHAAISLGGIVTTIGPLATADEVTSQVTDSGATWLAAGSGQLERLPPASRGAAFRQVFVLDAEPFPRGNDSGSHTLPSVTIDPLRDLALLPYSSGTTGVAKGVELTHATLVHNLAQT